MEFTEKNAYATAFEIVNMAIDNFPRRKDPLVYIPDKSMDVVAGFSSEAIISALGGSLQPLISAIEKGKLRGIAGVVGCNNPKIKHDHAHFMLVKELIKHDVLVVSTGCNAIACAKAGLMQTDAGRFAGDGLKKVCRQLDIPPVLHMGSCVDNSRILTFAGAIAKELDCDISDLPIAGGAPEWMSQKAVSIATYFLGSGITTVLGVVPPVLGSKNVSTILCNEVEAMIGAKFTIEPDPVKAAAYMIHHIDMKRSALFSGFKILELATVKTKRNAPDSITITD